MSDAPQEHYEGNCQCGKVRWTLTHPSLSSGAAVDACNCSICTRSGYLLIYPPKEQVQFTRGFDTLTTYKFGNAAITHYFCPTCGSSIGGVMEGKPFWAVNVRMLKGVDVEGLVVVRRYARDWEPKYELESDG